MDTEQISTRAKQLKKQGLSYEKAAEVLNQEGYKTATGLPMKINSVQYYANLKKQGTDTVRKASDFAPFVEAIKRLKSLGISEASRKKIVNLILDDLMDST